MESKLNQNQEQNAISDLIKMNEELKNKSEDEDNFEDNYVYDVVGTQNEIDEDEKSENENDDNFGAESSSNVENSKEKKYHVK